MIVVAHGFLLSREFCSPHSDERIRTPVCVCGTLEAANERVQKHDQHAAPLSHNGVRWLTRGGAYWFIAEPIEIW